MSVVETAAVIAATVFCCHILRKIADARKVSMQKRPVDEPKSADSQEICDASDSKPAAVSLVKMRAAVTAEREGGLEVPWGDMDVVRDESRVGDDPVHDGISLDLLSSALSGRLSADDCMRISSAMKGSGLEHEAAAVQTIVESRGASVPSSEPVSGDEYRQQHGLPDCFVRK